MTLLAFLGSRAHERSTITAPSYGKKNDSTKLEQLTKDVIQLSQDVSTASLSELEKIYPVFRSYVQQRETFTSDEEWEMVVSESVSMALGFIDQKLSEIKAILSKTNAHKEHVLQQLSSLRDALLTHITEKGIFRIPGGTGAVTSLAKRLEMNPKADLSEEKRDTLVAVFKKIVRELDVPLLKSKQDELLVIDLSEKNINAKTEFKQAVSQLDSPEYKITKLMIEFLSEVASHSDTNKMKPENLAICMGPNLFSFPSDPLKELTMTRDTTSIVRFMIENCSEIFE